MHPIVLCNSFMHCKVCHSCGYAQILRYSTQNIINICIFHHSIQPPALFLCHAQRGKNSTPTYVVSLATPSQFIGKKTIVKLCPSQLCTHGQGNPKQVAYKCQPTAKFSTLKLCSSQFGISVQDHKLWRCRQQHLHTLMFFFVCVMQYFVLVGWDQHEQDTHTSTEGDTKLSRPTRCSRA